MPDSYERSFKSMTMADFKKIAPEAFKNMVGISAAVDLAGMDKGLTELIKTRVSQINGCIYCLQFHLNAARKAGVTDVKLDQLAAWGDSTEFSPREKAALQLAEWLTRPKSMHKSVKHRARINEYFTEAEVVLLTLTIGTINSWNRLGVTLGFPADPRV
ncbi:MAG: carboxymuconolactone decarboxylase family protein [Candidatus Pacebacteria bacterium]|nr:carboxymuconolactone decarboxylase family protein [Candidatus Paceibacterota bacterium]